MVVNMSTIEIFLIGDNKVIKLKPLHFDYELMLSLTQKGAKVIIEEEDFDFVYEKEIKLYSNVYTFGEYIKLSDKEFEIV